MQKHKHPAEIIVWDILPALRKAIALRMLFKGIKQREIASILGLTESAVSQYAKNKRALDISFSPIVLKQIDSSIELITSKKSSILIETQKLLNLPQVRKKICEIHHSTTELPKNCEICFAPLK
jgi:predicted transcriptional regulator